VALNKNFFVPTYELRHGDQIVGTLRGITPDDIARVMSENAADVESLMASLEKDKILARVDPNKDEDLRQALADNSAKLFQMTISLVPDLVAKIIAVAMDEPGESQFIRKSFNVALQLEAIVQIAKLTFVDQNGFKAFLGNVMGLAAGTLGGEKSSPSLLAQNEAPTTDTAG
jgi:hypothetical protein